MQTLFILSQLAYIFSGLSLACVMVVLIFCGVLDVLKIKKKPIVQKIENSFNKLFVFAMVGWIITSFTMFSFKDERINLVTKMNIINIEETENVTVIHTKNGFQYQGKLGLCSESSTNKITLLDNDSTDENILITTTYNYNNKILDLILPPITIDVVIVNPNKILDL